MVIEKYTYDNGGTKETKLLGLLNNGAVFNDSYQALKTYNTNNDILVDVRQVWNAGTMLWQDTNRETSAYNAMDKVAMLTSEFFDGTNWNVSSEITYTYDGSGNLVEETVKTFSFVSMMLENSSRELLEYTGGLLTKHTDQLWNPSSTPPTWENLEKAEITNTGGLPTFALYSSWDTGTMAWIANERDTATYNGSDQLIGILVEDFVGGVWENSDKVTLTYVNGRLSEFLDEIWDGANWVNALRELFTYDTDGNNIEFIIESWDTDSTVWVGSTRHLRYYSPASPLSVESLDSFDIKFYPNPVSDIVNIKLNTSLSNRADVALHSLDGKLIKESVFEEGQENLQLDLHDIRQGMYLLRISNNHVFRLVKH